MRWKKLCPPIPIKGDKRTRLKFAWWPTIMSDRITWVWLERYWTTEKYMELFVGHDEPPLLMWVEMEREEAYFRSI